MKPGGCAVAAWCHGHWPWLRDCTSQPLQPPSSFAKWHGMMVTVSLSRATRWMEHRMRVTRAAQSHAQQVLAIIQRHFQVGSRCSPRHTSVSRCPSCSLCPQWPPGLYLHGSFTQTTCCPCHLPAGTSLPLGAAPSLNSHRALLLSSARSRRSEVQCGPPVCPQ